MGDPRQNARLGAIGADVARDIAGGLGGSLTDHAYGRGAYGELGTIGGFAAYDAISRGSFGWGNAWALAKDMTRSVIESAASDALLNTTSFGVATVAVGAVSAYSGVVEYLADTLNDW